MSASKLGPLPAVSGRGGRGLTGRPRLDEDALGSLLDSHGKTNPAAKSHRQKATRTRGSEEVKSYSHLANIAAEESEGEDEDVPVTAEETKQLADTVDIDDMDANLFGSFSRGKKAEGRPPRSRSSAAKSAPRGKKVEEPGLLAEAPPERTGPLRQGVVTGTAVPPGGGRKDISGDGDGDVGQTQNATRSENVKPSLKEGKTKGRISELDDDLLDLLSDSDHEDVAPKKRAKPTIQLKTSRTSTKPERGSSSLDGKPITSKRDTDNGGGMGDEERAGGLDRPKTSRGSSALQKPEELEDGGGGENKEKGGTDVLRLDSPPEQHPAITTTPVRTRSRAAVDSAIGSKIDFGEDEDDLLSGMGLDDSGTSSKTKDSGIFGAKRGSKVDELFGTATRKTTGRQLTKTAERKAENAKQPQRGAAEISGGGEEEEEEEDYQFGGYLPSAALGGDSRRRHSSEDSLTSRPSSAPAKKSVRFADTVDVEASDRPSSSPAVTDQPKPSLKGNRKGGTVGRPKEVDEASRKPPLPRKMDAAEQPVTKEGQVTEQQEGEMTGGNNLVGENKPTTGEFLSSDSLFLLDESAPKPRPLARGRRGIEKPFAAKLFDDNLKPDVQGEGGRGGEGGGGEGGGGEGGGEGGGGQEGGGQNEGTMSTSGDSGGLHMREDSNPKPVSADEKLEHPLFPWQTKKQSHLAASKRQVDAAGLGTVVESSAAPGNKENTTTVPTRRQNELPFREPVDSSTSVSFQEQLLQQQKQLQEQLMKLQLQGGRVYASEGALKNQAGREKEKLEEEWKAMQERVKEVEALLEKEKADHGEKQRKINELQQELQVCKESRRRVEEECRVLQGKVADMEREHQAVRLELNSQVDELKLKLHRAELEKDQARQLLEEGKARHSEELKAVQSANEARLKDMEESFQRRESRWREDMESEASRFQERLQQVERERVDAVTALKRKVDLVEVAKTNEINRLQEIHRAAVADLKNEHELNQQHMQSLHRQEVEALKAAHSHTWLLSELTHQVKASSHEVSQLQQRVNHAHSRGAEEREQGVRAQEEHLKMLEDRLSRQQAENEVERQRLQSLIAKLEAHVAQQSRQIEQERWQLRQEGLRLKAQQTAFEEEKMASLRKVEEEKDHLQQTKEKFLSEQQEVLAQCYEERRSLAAERAELSVLQKRALEREQRETQKSLQVEAEVEASLSHLREESTRIATEDARVREEGERVKREREVLERNREKLEVFGREIRQRSQEVEEMCKSAVEVRDQGERSLLEARTLQLELSEQSRTLERELMELREREKRFAAEQLALAQQRREVQHLAVVTRSSCEELHPLGRTADEMLNTWSGGTDTVYAPVYPPSLPPLHTHPTITTTTYAPPPQSGKSYSPRASPVHTPFHSSSSTKSSLAQLQHSRNMREIALLAEKDREDLKEECEFLESLQNSLL